VEEILCKGALVRLHLEIVLVLGEILGHGDEFVADVVPHVQHLVGPGLRGLWTLSLRGKPRARG
jgi:hypothetical protein